MEDFLTEVFVEWLRLASQAGFFPEIQRDLLRLTSEHCLADPAACRQIAWGTQHVIGSGYKGASGKRPDILGKAEKFFLIIENKIGAAFTEYESDDGHATQLELYKSYQQAQRLPFGGVVLITHWTTPPPGWTEAITWREVHQWLVAFLKRLSRSKAKESQSLIYWTTNLIHFLEENGMQGTRIQLSDIIALPAYERLQEGLYGLGSIAQNQLSAGVTNNAWWHLRVPNGNAFGSFVAPYFHGWIMTPAGKKTNDSKIVLWAGVLSGEAYELEPVCSGIPDLSVGIAFWSQVKFDSPDFRSHLEVLQQKLNQSTPGMQWKVEWKPETHSPENGFGCLRADLSLIDLHRIAGEDFWDDSAAEFFKRALEGLLSLSDTDLKFAEIALE